MAIHHSCAVFMVKILVCPNGSSLAKMFIEGREYVYDDEHSGRSVTSCQANAIAAVQEVIDSDKQLMLDKIMTLLTPNIEISQSSLHIMVEDLQLSKVYARWVPAYCLTPISSITWQLHNLV